MKEQIQLKDFLGYRFLSDVRYAPGGANAAFVSAVSDVKEGGYRQSLYVWNGNGVKELETLSHSVLYEWEDEKTLLFADNRREEDKAAVERGEERTAFYKASVCGGPAKWAFTLPLTVTDIRKADQDTYILTAKYDLNYSHMYLLSDAEKEALLEEKKAMADYEIIDELPCYGNGLG